MYLIYWSSSLDRRFDHCAKISNKKQVFEVLSLSHLTWWGTTTTLRRLNLNSFVSLLRFFDQYHFCIRNRLKLIKWALIRKELKLRRPLGVKLIAKIHDDCEINLKKCSMFNLSDFVSENFNCDVNFLNNFRNVKLVIANWWADDWWVHNRS